MRPMRWCRVLMPSSRRRVEINSVRSEVHQLDKRLEQV